MSLAVCALVFLASGAETGFTDEAIRLSRLGHHAEAERILRPLKSPIAKAMRALYLGNDQPIYRESGLTRFDRQAAEKLAREAIPELRKNLTDPEMASVLGNLCFAGIGLEPNNKEAARLWKWAAEHGQSGGMWRMALCFRDGFEVKQDPVSAFNWAKKCADSGNPSGQRLLAEFYDEGIGTSKDSAKALLLWEKAAKSGDVSSILVCANLALNRMIRANASGDLKATNRYRSAYKEWLDSGIAAGSAEAHLRMGALLQTSILGRQPGDDERSFREYRAAARSELPKPLLNLACCYYRGWGCQVDTRKGESFLLDAVAAAKRDHDDDLVRDIEDVIAEREPDARTKGLEELLHWPN